MFSLTVRDHMMVAHSFNSPTFGPAQKLHGATFVVDLTFFRPSLDEDDLVIDIGLAATVLKDILSVWNYQNLDELDEFNGRNTTTEFLAKAVVDRMAARIQAGDLGPNAQGIRRLKASLGESHIAWASYETEL